MGMALGNAAGTGAMALPFPGGAPASGVGGQQMANPLAQLLAGLGPNYQVPDTRWGMPGDRLLRFTPQQGNAGMAAGGFGKGGQPPGPGGGGGNGTVPPGIPGLPAGSPVTIDWAKLLTATTPPSGDPAGAPAINTAMQKLQTPPAAGPRPADAVATTRAAWHAVQQERPPHSASQAEKAAWAAKLSAAQDAYVAAQKASGYGAGVDPYSPFAPGQVGSL